MVNDSESHSEHATASIQPRKISWAQHIRAILGATTFGGVSAPSHTQPLTAQTHLTTHYDLKGLFAWRARKNSDGPLIVFIHGSPGGADGWADYLVDPEITGNKIAIDRPGFGASGFLPGDETLSQQAAVVSQLLGGRPAILVGHSFGGPVALQAAHDLGNQIQGVLLVAAAADPIHERILAIQHFGEWPFVRHMLPKALRSANRELIALPAGLHELGPLLAKITAHISVIHSDDDVLVPVENVAYLKRELTNCASYVERILSGRNHFLPWNSYEEVSGQLNELIARSADPKSLDGALQNDDRYQHD